MATCFGFCHQLQQRLWSCQQRSEFCDVILETDSGESVLAHKVIIASGSQVLHNMLVDTNGQIQLKDKNGEAQVLRIPDVSIDTLRDLVRFLYLGNVEKIRMETVTLWERFQISDPIMLSDAPPNLTDPPPQPKSPLLPKIKSECALSGKEDGYVEGESISEEENNAETNTIEAPGTEIKSEDSKEGPDKRRKRKCSSPKPRRVLEEFSTTEEDTSSDETYVAPKPVAKQKASPRKRNPRLKTKNIVSEVQTPKKKKVARTPAAKKEKVVKPPAVKTPPEKYVDKYKTLCQTCNIQFDTEALYKEHRTTMHNTRHTCFECGATFNRGNRLKAHRIEHHYKEGLPQPKWHHCKAEGCDYKSVYTDSLALHYNAIHVKERVICEICAASFTLQYYLNRHIKRVHQGEPMPCPCSHCEAGFFTPAELKIHEDRVHKKHLNFLCDRCPYRGYDKQSIQLHMFSKHGVKPEGRPTYDCPHCDYKSIGQAIIKAHIERHEQKDFRCEQCDSVYRCNKDLVAHRRLRHSTKPRVSYKCPYEGCKFDTIYGPSPLKHHISRMHENKDFKPWACEVCNYRTNVKGNLHLHIRKVHKLVPHIMQRRIPRVPAENPPVSESSSANETKNNAPSNTVQENVPSSVPTIYPTVTTTEATVPVFPTYQTLAAAQVLQEMGSGMPLVPAGGLSGVPTSSMTGTSTGGMPVVPTSCMPVVPTSGMPVVPTSGMSVVPTSGMPVPTSGIPVVPTRGMPDPTSGMPVVPTSVMSVVPTSGMPVPTSGMPVVPTSGMHVAPISGMHGIPTSGMPIVPTNTMPVSSPGIVHTAPTSSMSVVSMSGVPVVSMAGMPVLPPGHYGMPVPPSGYDASMFMQGLQ